MLTSWTAAASGMDFMRHCNIFILKCSVSRRAGHSMPCTQHFSRLVRVLHVNVSSWFSAYLSTRAPRQGGAAQHVLGCSCLADVCYTQVDGCWILHHAHSTRWPFTTWQWRLEHFPLWYGVQVLLPAGFLEIAVEIASVESSLCDSWVLVPLPSFWGAFALECLDTLT